MEPQEINCYLLNGRKVMLDIDWAEITSINRSMLSTYIESNVATIPKEYYHLLDEDEINALKESMPANKTETLPASNIYGLTEIGAFDFTLKNTPVDQPVKSEVLLKISNLFKVRAIVVTHDIHPLFPLQQLTDEEKDSEAHRIKYYHQVLDSALKNENILNIALSAPYGAGKTTVISTFFNTDTYLTKVIYVSLSKFESADKVSDVAGENKQKSEEKKRQKVEKIILQQLIYQESPDNLPESRILRIYNISDEKKNYGKLHIFVFIAALFIIFLDRILSNSFARDLQYLYLLFKIIGMIAITIIATNFVFNLFKSVKNIKINKFGTVAGSIEMTNTKELSIFNQHLDEILYFFECTGFEFVIIEDLDRFGDPVIFNRLKTLNRTINNYPPIKQKKGKITFIYAIKDDIFINDHRDRTKFFDLIIPIIPIINSYNSNEKFRRYLTMAFEHDGIDNGLINDLSDHIQDMRLLKNIVNEFIVHKNVLLRNNRYDKNELLAAIIYKNLDPTDYAEFHEDRGRLKHIGLFKSCLLKFSKNELEIQLKEINKKLSNASENQQALLLQKTEIEDKIESVGNIPLKDYLDLGIIDKTSELEPFLDDLFTSLKIDTEGRKKPLKDTYLKSNVFRKLIGTGFLNEHTAKFISITHMDSLSFDEQQYVQALRDRKDPSNIELAITEKMAEYIGESVFDHKCTQIPNLIEFIFAHDGYNKPCNNAINLLARQKGDSFIFLNKMLDRKTVLLKIVNHLCRRWDDFFFKMPTNTVSLEQETQYLKAIISNLDDKKFNLELLDRLNKLGTIRDHIEIQEKLSEVIDFAHLEKFIKIIKHLKVKFKNLSDITDYDSVAKAIIEESLYQLTLPIFLQLLEYKFSQNWQIMQETAETQNWSFILEHGPEEMRNYIRSSNDCFRQYVEDVFLALENNTKETEAAIIDLLNSQYLDKQSGADYSIVRKMILRSKSKINDLNSVPINFWAILIQENKIQPSWYNIYVYYKGTIDDPGFVTDLLNSPSTYNYLESWNLKTEEITQLNTFKSRLYADQILTKKAYTAIVKATPVIDDLTPFIKDIDELEKLKILIDEKRIEINQINIDAIKYEKPDSLAYFFHKNIKEIKELSIKDDWYGVFTRGHHHISDKELEALIEQLWPLAEGFYKIRKLVGKRNVLQHNILQYKNTVENMPVVDDTILKKDSGFIMVWVFLNNTHRPNEWIVSHALDGGKKHEEYAKENRYFYPSGWGIHTLNTNAGLGLKLTAYKKEVPQIISPSEYIGVGLIYNEKNLSGWNLLTIAWSKKKNYIKLAINDQEVGNEHQHFNYGNNWPDVLSGRINFGCWDTRTDVKHHFKGKIGPYMMVSTELNNDLLATYLKYTPT